jgi:metal-responsive CopG/Arc/MetJ family transcriptional regulator
MKTAISLPDETFDAADRRAQQLGVSRSEFFATAARRYLEELTRSSLTQQIDEALAHITSDDSAQAAVEAGQARLAAGDDW